MYLSVKSGLLFSDIIDISKRNDTDDWKDWNTANNLIYSNPVVRVWKTSGMTKAMYRGMIYRGAIKCEMIHDMLKATHIHPERKNKITNISWLHVLKFPTSSIWKHLSGNAYSGCM
jgi:hypothetical protein